MRRFRKQHKGIGGVVVEKEAGKKECDCTKCGENDRKRNISHTFLSILCISEGGRGCGDGEVHTEGLPSQAAAAFRFSSSY